MKLTKELLQKYYTKDNLTLEEIGALFDISKQAVHKKAQKFKINTTRARSVDIECKHCGDEFKVSQSRFYNRNPQYCSRGCHSLYRRSQKIYVI